MKMICIVLGIASFVVAAMYFVMPADSLPAFFPGYEAGLARMHTKHGVVAAVVGVVMFALGWLVGRK